jgi:hypothetical protein
MWNCIENKSKIIGYTEKDRKTENGEPGGEN